jgi:dihydroorotase
MRYLIKNGSIIDPTQRVATIGHILIEDGKVSELFDIAELGTENLPSGDDIEVIYAQGCIIAPGLTDLHAHLREPGEEYKETIATGTMAAAQGGFTTVCAMPNTQPPHDRASVVRQIRQIAMYEGCVHVDVIGAITLGRAGITLTEMAELVEAGCIAFSDDGSPVSDPAIMRNAMSYASMLGVPIMSHCEDTRLNPGWAMHEGIVSTRLGLPGYPAAAEEAQIARDIALAELTGAHLHICHVSTEGGVALIRNAKERGVVVTAEVTPHHLTLSDEWVLGWLARTVDSDMPHPYLESIEQRWQAEREQRARERGEQGLRQPSWLDPTLLAPYDPSTRVSPPLRSRRDIEALLDGIVDNTIDAIATDHAPHAAVNKTCEYGLAACGISGLETALGLLLTLVHSGSLDMMSIVAKLTEGPAQVLGRSPSSLRPGARANLVVFDPEHNWTVDTSQFVSKGKNSPLHGQRLKGQVMLTMMDGDIIFRREAFGSVGMGAPQASRLDGILPEDA